LRAILNFGHTVGHAVEALTGYTKYLHGEAVAIGMAAAAAIAAAMSLCGPEVPERINGLLEAVGLPARPDRIRAADVIAALARDKKAVGGKARFVLPRRIGEVTIVDEAPVEILRKALVIAGFTE
jgi:3-dehydroquinate synthase